MTKISNKIAYNVKSIVNPNDYVIGTDSETSNKQTKNYMIGDIASYAIAGLSPEVGGTIKITEIVPVTEETDPVVVANAISPDYQVMPYELFFINLNGVIHLLKLVNRSIGSGSTALPPNSFVSWPVSVGEDGADGEDGQDGVGIESIELTNTSGLVKTYTITFTDSTTFDFDVTDGADGDDGQDGVGIESIELTNTSGLVKTYTITFTDSTTFDFDVTDGADGESGSSVNLQRIQATSFSLANTDDKHTIFLNNGSSNITITVPSTLSANFICAFVQQGTGNVEFQAGSGATINASPGSLIQGQHYSCIIEKVENTTVYQLSGQLKAS